VGRVLTVDVSIKAMLETRANRYSHQNCTPRIRPGNIIINFVENAQNSIVFVMFQ
jgi:hypothetical protein